MKKKLIHLASLTLVVISILMLSVVQAFAATATNMYNYTGGPNTYKFTDMKVSEDNCGYANASALSTQDPLFGVDVLEIVISNFSSTTVHNGRRVFLKSSPDVPVLNINVLVEDLDNVGETGVKVCSDSATAVSGHGYRGKVGYGLLIVEHTDYTGKKTVYPTADLFNELKENTDILPGVFGQEGSYKVSVFWETQRYVKTVKDWKSPFHYRNKDVYEYLNYSVKSEFEIRNGNTMVYAFDHNGNELLNGSVVSGGGFYLDLANSRYLDVQVKRDVVTQSGFLKEASDTRFNAVGATQRLYSAEGLYTIEVKNPVTGASTTKKILVAGPQDENLKTAVANTHSADFPELAKTSHVIGNYAQNSVYAESQMSVDYSNQSSAMLAIVVAMGILMLCVLVGAVIVLKKVRR